MFRTKIIKDTGTSVFARFPRVGAPPAPVQSADITAPIISNFTTTESVTGIVKVTGTIDETSTVVIKRDGTLIATLTNQTTSFSYEDTTVSPSTTYTYTAVATDASNNKSTTASSTITTTGAPDPDTTAPIISNFTTTESAGDVIVSGDIDETSTVVISRGGTVIATLTNQTTSFTYTDTTVSPGTTYTYTAVATDASNNSSTTASSTITTADPVYTVTVHAQAHPNIQVNNSYRIRANETDLKLTSGGTQLAVTPTVYNTNGTGSTLDDDVLSQSVFWIETYTLYPNDTSPDKADSKLFSLVTDSPQSSAPERLEVYWHQPRFTPTIRVFVNGVDKGTFAGGKGTGTSPSPNKVIYNIS